MSGTVTPPIYNRYQERALYNQEGFSAKYTHKLSESLRIEPSFDYVSGPQAGQEALQSGVLSSVNGPNGTMLEKYKGEISVSYDPDKQSNVVGGVGYIRDQGESINSDGSPAFYGSNASDLQFKRAVESMFLYGQYMRKIGDFNLTAGARYENTSFGSAVAPRVGITYQYDKYNAKLLYGRSYRIPSVYQAYSNLLNYNPDGLKPETSNTLEAEFGYRISKNMNSKINLFLIEINQLIYFATVGSSYYYANFSGVQQSYGAEAELNYKEKDYGAYLNASLAMPGQQSNAVYLTNDKKYALGLPPLKVTFGGYFNLAKLVVSPTFEVLSRRYGVGADGVTSQGYDALFLANLAVTWKEIIENTDLRLSGHNLLNSNYVLLQPYYGSNAPLPANNRDVRLEFQTRL
jgi:outer membrane cobalamin receptor